MVVVATEWHLRVGGVDTFVQHTYHVLWVCGVVGHRRQWCASEGDLTVFIRRQEPGHEKVIPDSVLGRVPLVAPEGDHEAFLHKGSEPVLVAGANQR